MKVKSWTPHQLNRLPKPGYWLLVYTPNINNEKWYHAYCVMNGYIRYVRSDMKSEWNTLLWSCMPTQKQIANPNPEEQFHYFPDLDSMRLAFPDLPGSFFIKPENDF
jgi:hypothetical protein